jgi:hypothetical protein
VHFTFELSKASKVILVSKVSKVTAVLCLVLWMFVMNLIIAITYKQVRLRVLNAILKNIYFSYIVAVSFTGGGNQSTWRKTQTCRKSLTNFITIILPPPPPNNYNILKENAMKQPTRGLSLTPKRV